MYTSKKEADAHDKMLDIAEGLFLFIEKAAHIDLRENQIEELSIYLSNNREEVIRILKGAPAQPLETGHRELEEASEDTSGLVDKNVFKEKKNKRAAEM